VSDLSLKLGIRGREQARHHPISPNAPTVSDGACDHCPVRALRPVGHFLNGQFRGWIVSPFTSAHPSIPSGSLWS